MCRIVSIAGASANETATGFSSRSLMLDNGESELVKSVNSLSDKAAANDSSVAKEDGSMT